MFYVIIGTIMLGIFLYGKRLYESVRVLFILYARKISVFVLLLFSGMIFVFTRSFVTFVCALSAFGIYYGLYFSTRIKINNASSSGDGKTRAGHQYTGHGRKRISRKDALEILGLKDDAKVDEIRNAHRNLIKRLHPDLGGSHYLTSIINEAKEVLLSD